MVKRRLCDNCKTPLRNGHGFPTKKGGLFCGRTFTMTTVNGGFVRKYLGCNKW